MVKIVKIRNIVKMVQNCAESEGYVNGDNGERVKRSKVLEIIQILNMIKL